jgi:hypothetical protein
MMQYANKHMDDKFRLVTFSDKVSYKILCISSYRLKDTNFARYAHLQQYFSKTEKLTGTFLTQRTLGREADTWGPMLTGTLTKQIWRGGAGRGWQQGPGCQRSGTTQKDWTFCPALESNYGSPARFRRNRPARLGIGYYIEQESNL